MKSLKNIHLSISALLAIIVIGSAWFGNAYIYQQQQHFISNTTERGMVLEAVHNISASLTLGHSAIDDLVLLPHEQRYLDSFYSSLAQADASTAALIDLEAETTKKIKRKLKKVLNIINELDYLVESHFYDNSVIQSVFYNTEVAPVFEILNKIIKDVEISISNLSSEDTLQLSNSNSNLIKALTYLALIGLILTFAIFISVDKLLLKPLNLLSKILNQESNNEKTSELPIPKYTEMESLIEAFIRMRDQVRQRETESEHNALHDTLTNLPNRLLLLDRLQQLIKEAKRNNTHPGIIILDLDKFKEINDTLGHQIGDILLQDVSKRLQNILRNLDSIARLGGDEFAILLHNVDVEGAKIVANKITTTMSLPFNIENHQLLVNCSQGISIYPEHGNTVTDLIKHADIAMYIAKRGNFGHNIYNSDDDQRKITDIFLSADLKSAIVNNELQLYYQPKVNAKNAKVIEVEALLRWTHPERGFVSPEIIVEVAEQSGLIQALTEWVLKAAIKQTSEWIKTGINIGVAVNLSTHNFQNPHLITIIQYLLNDSKINPDQLILEITEGAMMANPKLAADVLSQLNEMGIRIAIDDFGTGYSSLAYLKNLPVHELKIDRSFVMNIATDESDVSIVKSTIDLAHNLGLSVVAEGVEDRESWDILENLGCDIIQGYFISRPIPVKDFENWYVDYSLSLIDKKRQPE